MNTDPKHNPEPMHPVLVEVTRGPIVESVHHGVVAVTDVNGTLVAWAGNPGLVTYYRSSSKPIQAIPLVEGGGADHFGLTPAEIAITCGSHGGEDIHVEAVRSILAKIGVGEDALACGTHMPYDKAAAFALESRAQAPSVLHNNCSGKHAGMLALARFNGWPIGGYETPAHPVQQVMLNIVAEFAGLSPDYLRVGIDGCGVCTFGMPVTAMAMSFARLADPDFWPEPRRTAVRRIIAAMTAHPEMVDDTVEGFDTDLMRAAGKSLLSKGGAEGLQCAARVASDGQPALGFALKLLDGDRINRARNPATMEGLRQAGLLSEETLDKMESYWMEEVRNRPGDVVGVVRPAFTLNAALPPEAEEE